uniref:Uncharacterized protein n=1 Tax=Oryza glumipatula TaxID=40148 RepID=A0A0E0AEY0_9ORYZ
MVVGNKSTHRREGLYSPTLPPTILSDLGGSGGGGGGGGGGRGGGSELEQHGRIWPVIIARHLPLLPVAHQPRPSRIAWGQWSINLRCCADAERRRHDGSRGAVTTRSDDTTNVAMLEFIRELLNDLRDAVWSLRREKDELVVAVREGQAMARDVDAARRELAALKKHVVETDAKLVLLKEQNRRLEKDRCMLFFCFTGNLWSVCHGLGDELSSINECYYDGRY